MSTTIKTLTFMLCPTDDRELTCIVCRVSASVKPVDHEFAIGVNGGRTFLGIHEACCKRAVALETSPTLRLGVDLRCRYCMVVVDWACFNPHQNVCKRCAKERGFVLP